MNREKNLKILLSYSKTHFDPGKLKDEHKYWGSSANILARALYEELLELGEVTYINPDEALSLKNKQFDLFVGQAENFAEIVKIVKPKKSIYWSVNMHPRTRNKKIQDFTKARDLDISRINHGDIVDTHKIEASLAVADYILGVGNVAVLNSYLENGINQENIFLINYAVGSSIKKPHEPVDSRMRRYVYLSSDIGLRKGFDVMPEIVSFLKQTNKPFKLDIVGKVNKQHYIDLLKPLLSQKNITFHGWLESESRDLKKVLSSSDFLIFPSLEEGQAGTVLDCMRYGIVPLHTAESGVDFAPLGFLDTISKSKNNAKIIKQAQEISDLELHKIKTRTLEAYREYHEGFQAKLGQFLSRAIYSTHFLPKVSVVLSIYNKEKTILGLLRRLDRALIQYGNAELIIIFDGCKDKTEQIVRGYFKKKQSYPIKFEVTPNIFEVASNNLGLKIGDGEYCVIIQDDNYVNDLNFLLEAVTFFEKNNKVVILGGLAGVNFYPLGTKLSGKGQIAMTENEVYWRQDEKTNSRLKERFFEVDACMRGPLFIRKEFLEKHGYLDEAYMPLYNDDMDLAFRARKFGYKVYAVLMNVENRSETIAHYSPERAKFWKETIEKNAKLLYSRWAPSAVKDYAWTQRILIAPAKKQALYMKSEHLREMFGSIKGRVAHHIKSTFK